MPFISKIELGNYLNGIDPKSGDLLDAVPESKEAPSEGLKLFLDFFKGKEEVLVFYEIRSLFLRFQEQEGFELNLITLNSIKDIPEKIPNNQLIIWDVTIDDTWDEHALHTLLTKANAFPLFALKIKGNPPREFIRQLNNPRIQLENSDPSLSQFATQISYRNHLRALFKITNGDDDKLLKEWTLIPDREGEPGSFYYLKLFNYSTVNYKAKIKDYIKSKPTPLSHECLEAERYSLINACVSGMGPLFFDLLIKNIPPHLMRQFHTLVINKNVDVPILQSLSNNLPSFRGLNLFINPNNHPEILKPFQDLCLQLNSNIEELSLTIPPKNIYTSEIEETCKLLDPALFQDFKPRGKNGPPPVKVKYFIKFEKQTTRFKGTRLREHEDVHHTYVPEREAIIMEHLQKENYQKLITRPLHPYQVVKKHNPIKIEEKKETQEEHDPYAEKITIKAVIFSKNTPIDIPIEVIHQEQEEEQHIVQQQAEQKNDRIQQIEQKVEENQLGGCDPQKKLISFYDFIRPPYGPEYHAFGSKFDQELIYEFFSPLPGTIGFMTHEAALQVAREITAYAAMDSKTKLLASQFDLSLYESGDLRVLEFDPYLERPQVHFVPYTQYKQAVKDLICNETVYDSSLKAVKPSVLLALDPERLKPSYANENQILRKLYQSYGIRGVDYFFEQLSTLTSNHPDFDVYLSKHYLSHFYHLDCFLENNDFFDALTRINQFDSVQLTCFKKFIEKTGSSRHDLKKTVSSFEEFWSQWSFLAAQNNLELEAINCNWQTAVNGNPIVYMGRLLSILTRAACLSDQLKALDGIILRLVGPYYFSEYVNLGYISAAMKTGYEPNFAKLAQNKPDTQQAPKIQFLKWENILECKTFSDLLIILARDPATLAFSLWDFEYTINELQLTEVISPALITTVFLMSSKRNKKNTALAPLLGKIRQLEKQNLNMVHNLNKALFQWQQQGIYFDSYEGGLLCDILLKNQSIKPSHLNVFLNHLGSNPYNSLQAIESLIDHKMESSLIRVLDWHQALTDAISLPKYYQNQLVLFLVPFAQDKEAFSFIESFLKELAKLPKPNNHDLLFKKILKRTPPLQKELVQINALAFDEITKQLERATARASKIQYCYNTYDEFAPIEDWRGYLMQELLKQNSSAELKQDNSSHDLEALWDTIEAGQQHILLEHTKNGYISNKFVKSRIIFGQDLRDLPFFRECTELNHMEEFSQNIDYMAETLTDIKLDNDIVWSVYTSEDLKKLLEVMYHLKKKKDTNFFNRLALLQQELKTEFIPVLDIIGQLDKADVPDTFLEKLILHIKKSPKYPLKPLSLLSERYNKGSNPLVVYMMELPVEDLLACCSLLPFIPDTYAKSLVDFLPVLFIPLENKQFFLEQCKLNPEEASVILQLMAKLYQRRNLDKTKNKESFDYTKLYTELKKLSTEQRNSLLEQFKINPPSPQHFANQLELFNTKPGNFEAFLAFIEKNPVEVRNLEAQFDISQVKRVINESTNKLTGKTFSLEYRKRWLEAFLFVNDRGHRLPCFNNKPTKDLSNKEIQAFFKTIKSNKGKIDGLDFFTSQLYALCLLREAMYRTTGKFPYSTQILAVINSLFYDGNLVTAMKTGDGKSITDFLEISLAWLSVDSCDYATDTVENAARDLNYFSPFLDLLDIPHGNEVITGNSSKDAYSYSGINISTGAQFEIYRMRLQSLDQLDPVKEKRSLFLKVNELDFLSLYDHQAYRYGFNVDETFKGMEEWIYTAINQFVKSPQFKNPDNSLVQDVRAFKDALIKKAPNQIGAEKIEKLDKAQCVKWIKAAVIVQYVLEEGIDYGINTVWKSTQGKREKIEQIEILSKYQDGTTDFITGSTRPGSSFGEGIHPLLQDKLNQEAKYKRFPIQQQMTKQLTSTPRNFLEYYLSKKAKINGSTATPGSKEEMQELRAKYFFDFVSLAPHLPSRLIIKPPVFESDRERQFQCILNELRANNQASVVFFKNSKILNTFHQFLQKQHFGRPISTYYGLGDQATLIEKSGQPGHVTLCTGAMGRNTDIPYNYEDGLAVYRTFPSILDEQIEGRTGRQGSKGTVYAIYNKEDLGNRSILDILNSSYGYERTAREHQDELYTLFFVFFTIIKELDEEAFKKDTNKNLFITDKWTIWCSYYIDKYKQERANGTYDHNRFYFDIEADFLVLLNGALQEPYTKVIALLEANPQDLNAISDLNACQTKALSYQRPSFISSNQEEKAADMKPSDSFIMNLLESDVEEMNDVTWIEPNVGKIDVVTNVSSIQTEDVSNEAKNETAAVVTAINRFDNSGVHHANSSNCANLAFRVIGGFIFCVGIAAVTLCFTVLDFDPTLFGIVDPNLIVGLGTVFSIAGPLLFFKKEIGNCCSRDSVEEGLVNQA